MSNQPIETYRPTVQPCRPYGTPAFRPVVLHGRKAVWTGDAIGCEGQAHAVAAKKAETFQANAAPPVWEYNDGGREAATGKDNKTGDCGVRAIAIACEIPYLEAVELVKEFAKRERKGKRKSSKSTPCGGVYAPTMRRIMESRGWVFVPTMEIGSGCKVHLTRDELPSGRLLVSVSRHYCAVVNGVIQDTYDPSRDGTRCVYGYYQKPDPVKKATDSAAELRDQLVALALAAAELASKLSDLAHALPQTDSPD